MFAHTDVPVFMRSCWFYRVATLTGLSLLKAGLHAKGLRLGITLTRGWSNRGSKWLRNRLWRPERDSKALIYKGNSETFAD